MTERHNQARGANEWADIYGSLGAVTPVQLTRLPLAILDPWEGDAGEAQPFKPYTPKMLADLAENIRANGVLQPILVRPKANGRFEIISGHNRVAASRATGIHDIPALVQMLNDDQAAIAMIDSNLKHRPFLLPSEKARAYAERMKRLRRMAGRPSNNCGPVGHNFDGQKSRDIIAGETGASPRSVQRYLCLAELQHDLLNMVDNAALDKESQDKSVPLLSIRAGEELSHLSKAEQQLLFQVMSKERCKAPSEAQAKQLRACSQEQKLDKDVICSILAKPRKPKAATVKLSAVRISSFFPPNTPPDQMEAEIYEALLAYRKNNNTPASA